jgi:hypothetical protein
LFEGDLKALGHKGNKDVCFNARLLRVINRPDRQVAFELFEALFDLGQLDGVLPQFSRVFSTEIGAQQVMPFAPTRHAEFWPIQGKGEALRRDRLVFFRDVDVDQRIGVLALSWLRRA